MVVKRQRYVKQYSRRQRDNTVRKQKKKKVPRELVGFQDYDIKALTRERRCGVRATWTTSNDKDLTLLGLRCEAVNGGGFVVRQ